MTDPDLIAIVEDDETVDVFHCTQEWMERHARTVLEVVRKLGLVPMPGGGWACDDITATRIAHTVIRYSTPGSDLEIDDDRLCGGCGDVLSGGLGARCGNCQAADRSGCEVLWEGETDGLAQHADDNVLDQLSRVGVDLLVPPGTRVRVVRADSEEPA